MFLKRLDLTTDSSRVFNELQNVLDKQEWGESNQIGLRHRPDAANKWTDAVGSLYNRNEGVKLSSERMFTEWTISSDWYVRQQIEILQRRLNIEIGRVRFMRLLPKRGLSVHKDDEVRYHLVLKTNPKAYMARASNFVIEQNSAETVVATCYHIPADEHWWRVDTREVHWVYNGGDEERIHLVVCGV